MNCDLHIHSTLSNGQASPEEIIREAEKNQIDIIAITDYTNYNKYKKGKLKKIITGMEIESKYCQIPLKLLLYGFDPKNKYIEEYNQKIRRYDIKKFKLKIKELKKIYNLTLDKTKVELFINENETFDLARLNKLLVYLNICETEEEAHTKYTFCIEEQRRKRINIKQAFRLEKKSGAVLSLAQPTMYYENFKYVRELILNLKNKYDLRAVEAINSQSSKEEIDSLIRICKKNNLYISGGTDYSASKKEKIGYINKEKISVSDVSILSIL